MSEVPLYSVSQIWLGIGAISYLYGLKYLDVYLKSFRLTSAGERGGDDSNGFKDFRTENGSSQGQKLVLTGFFVASSLDSGVGRCTGSIDLEHCLLIPCTLSRCFFGRF